MKRVVIVSPYVLSATEGYSIRTIRLGEALKEAGAELFIACPKGDIAFPWADQIWLPHIARRDLNLATEAELTLRLIVSALITTMNLVARRRSLKVVQLSQLMNPFYTLLSVVSVRILRLRLVYLMEDLAPECIELSYGLSRDSVLIGVLRLMEKLVSRSADLVVVPSISLARILNRASPRRVLVVHNVVNLVGIDGDDLNSTVLPVKLGRGFNVVYFGRIDKGLRGLEETVQSFTGLDESFHLLIIGSGDGKSYLLKLVEELGLDARVRVIGPYSRKALYAIIKRCNAVIIPYSTESEAHRVATPTKLFEAMALDKLIICPDTPGFREALGDKGVHYTENSVALIRQAIIKASKREQASNISSNQQRETMRELFAAGKRELSSYKTSVIELVAS